MTLIATGVVAGPLQGVDLRLGPGLTVLVGEQSSGASTLLRVLAGAEEPAAGVVAGGPTALLTAPPGDEWARHDVAVAALGAPHLVGREMWTLSGGERQRVRLARVLADPAPVLLLDEPLGYLDDIGVGSVLAVLGQLAGEGRAVLAVVKSDPRAAVAADRVVSLVDGRLVEGHREGG